MIDFRKLTHEDYEDIVDISKDIWDGTDYLPQVFHDWVEDDGIFLGAIDTDRHKVVGTDKLTLLPDGSGWLEGFRIHKDYQGQKIGKLLANKLLDEAKKLLSERKIQRIAFSTHITADKSIHLMTEAGFQLAQAYVLIQREADKLDNALTLHDFSVKRWELSFEDFSSLPYIKIRNNIFPLAFLFQKPTQALYDILVKGNCFVDINGHKGFYKFKGDPHFIAVEDTFEAINTFMNYYQLLHKGKNIPIPMTYVRESDTHLLEQLKNTGYSSWNNWQNDYLYYLYS